MTTHTHTRRHTQVNTPSLVAEERKLEKEKSRKYISVSLCADTMISKYPPLLLPLHLKTACVGMRVCVCVCVCVCEDLCVSLSLL